MGERFMGLLNWGKFLELRVGERFVGWYAWGLEKGGQTVIGVAGTQLLLARQSLDVCVILPAPKTE